MLIMCCQTIWSSSKRVPIKAILASNYCVRSANSVALRAGQERVARFGSVWQKADLEKAIARHAGSNATSWRTATGKTIFENPATNGFKATVGHNGTHTNAYLLRLGARLRRAVAKGTVSKELNTIRLEVGTPTYSR